MIRLLHLHSSFNPGGKEVRAVQLMNAFERNVEHTIVSAVPEAYDATARIDRGVRYRLEPGFPSLQGRPTPGRLQRLAAAMAGFDLVLTYNFGAMDGALAHTLFSRMLGLPPLVHHEDGFNEDEADRLKTSRNWYRRIGLGHASALIVPSQRLEMIARQVWRQPAGRVVRIANGIATSSYGEPARADALPRVIKRPGEQWLGTLAGLKPVKNLSRLVRAFARLPEPWQLVICGEGPSREEIRQEAQRCEVAHRVHLPGFVSDPAKVLGLFDLFALSSDSEQFPISVVEAMAAGLAVVSTAVGDVADMVAADNRAFVVPAGDEQAFGTALEKLAGDPGLRAALGADNRARARLDFDETAMVTAYRGVYGRVMRRPDFA